MFKLQPKTAGDAPSRDPQARLQGDRLAVTSAQEPDKWPLGRRLRVLVLLAVLAWLAALYLPVLLTDLAGLLLGLLLEAMG
ncbi:MAG: hypothetical protein R3285_08910 [Kiloniellales bacterium]|nr:hypothetical protein [Kiloniellales bacterium]